MQLFRVPPFLPLLVLSCWAVLDGVYGSCTTDDECLNDGKCDVTPSTCDCTGTGYVGDTCQTEGVCSDGGEECVNGGTCVTGTTPTTCTCADGYDGDTCENDIDECTASGDDAHDCDENAVCTNTPAGSYTCTCNEGFNGDGKTCTDIDECTATGGDAHDCDENAVCTNTPPGSYTCTCDEGFVGDGKTCTEGVCSEDGGECLNGGTCDTSSTPSTCSCADGYTGDTCQSGGGTVKISAYLMGMTVLTFFVIL